MMDIRKLRAKQLLQNNQLIEAKVLILEMINDNNKNYKLFQKLGDISIKLNQYKDGLRYYQESLEKNPSNSSIYIKIGDLLHEYLNDNELAQEKYEKCIEIDPNNELCWFKYGKLMFKQENLLKAEECYLNCKTPRGCIQYHYALLLLSKSSNTKQNQQKALNLLKEATKLQPDITKYHHQYALCLKDMGFINEANNAFKSAIKLSNNKDVVLLYEYAMFLIENYNEYEYAALEYLKIALNSTEHQQHPYIQQEFDNLYQQFMSHKLFNSNCIQLIVYELDEVITYHNLYKKLNGDINKLKNMRRTELIHDIFGGNDRLDRLHIHFQRILSSKTDIKDIKIVIVSLNDTNIITLALEMVDLMQYFSDIIGNDKSKYLHETKHKLKDIQQLALKYKLDLAKQVLFVDSNLKCIEFVSDHCITYHVVSDYLLNGLSMEHMKEIEEIFDVYIFDEYDIKSPNNNLCLSIRQINLSIYQSIKKEMGGVPNRSIPIESLPVIQFIEENWKSQEYQEHFLYFARMFKLVRKYRPKGRFWTNIQILAKLKEMVNDCEITRRYAKCLAYFEHYEEADRAFKLILERSQHTLHRLEYAHFLFKMKRYNEAEEYFEYLINHIDEFERSGGGEDRIYLGFARTLEMLEQPYKAERYYKLTIESVSSQFDNGHIANYMYGTFLYNHARYKESKYQFEIALNGNEMYANNHYGISKVLYKLGMLKDCEYHLKRTLEIDPYFLDAQNALNRYYNQQPIEEWEEWEENNKVEYNEKNMSMVDDKCVNTSYRVEFDRFWFDVIGIITADFNRYYDELLDQNMNNIRSILFNQNIEYELQNKIDIRSSKDLKIIMSAIHDLRNEHKRFVECLNREKLNAYYPIFAHNGIYTMHVLKCNVLCKNDIYGLIKCYNQENDNITNQFDENHVILMSVLEDFIMTKN